ncbi:alpha-1,3-arabinosyltransferase XAT3-like [Salvia miltiorrhiza]|uniref:alpha-1,3-arabinosyltransferase XAT3-like n=1 Tax=Salvia miltiorrhiza TaxID=226208 RepID=UPI0025AD3F3C|nr:alpha-1,3-arabinosyltransferase XAT3-like [Salvia miltiorrhiza]
MIKDVGFQVIVVRRYDRRDMKKLSQLVNSCSVLLGVHGASLTNGVFLPMGAVVIPIEPLDLEYFFNAIFGDNALAMGMQYLRYKIEDNESSLLKVFGRNSSVITDTSSVYRHHGTMASRDVFFVQQNVKLNLARFRENVVKALSIETDSTTQI